MITLYTSTKRLPLVELWPAAENVWWTDRRIDRQMRYKTIVTFQPLWGEVRGQCYWINQWGSQCVCGGAGYHIMKWCHAPTIQYAYEPFGLMNWRLKDACDFVIQWSQPASVFKLIGEVPLKITIFKHLGSSRVTLLVQFFISLVLNIVKHHYNWKVV